MFSGAGNCVFPGLALAGLRVLWSRELRVPSVEETGHPAQLRMRRRSACAEDICRRLRVSSEGAQQGTASFHRDTAQFPRTSQPAHVEPRVLCAPSADMRPGDSAFPRSRAIGCLGTPPRGHETTRGDAGQLIYPTTFARCIENPGQRTPRLCGFCFLIHIIIDVCI